ncbi:MAG TPA: 50S ribosomal protein L9 [Burkholderiales bacterium]|nr:50S ribosomal protein L9 [Burkholderiales bacterium]
MKVILLEEIPNVGNLGAVATVKNGYARNYLIPKGLALRATEANQKEFELKKAEYELNQANIVARSKARQEQINGQVYTIAAKAGVDGKLFGSVTALDIVEAAKNAGIEIKRSEILLPNGPFKTIGEFDVAIDLHHDIRAHIKLNITPES